MHLESGFYNGGVSRLVEMFIKFDYWVDLGMLSIPLHDLIK